MTGSMDSRLGDWAMTGAGGQIGSVLRPALSVQTDRLRLIDIEPLATQSDSEVAHVADVRHLSSLESAISGCDGIIHLAAIADEAPFEELLEVNIAGTLHVFEAARRAGVPRVIFSSSNHVTGMYDGQTLVDVVMAPRPDSLYAVTKITGEALGRMYADKFGLEVVCIRIGSSVPVPSEPRHRHTWLSDDDLVAAFVAAMTAVPLGFAIYYGSSANDESFWDLASGRAIGFDPADNAAAVPGSASQGETYSGLQGGEFALPDYTLRHL